ncbi:putative Atpase [Leptomonas pyrrhocoris]|uniref:Putative Atpase n=1 Tax=Leptomonas pyrrhocoris TaxID=157538 RepID=A0A0M9FVX0_LEPPY|nr:putative Atpase [Leptomonas pyrrhocoris]KPA77049.1 putative Atpase [Leptomonas pyrrhocoris]|eukprot:XP_015655488.1 putative Atpase [Leptomonas pyrrhocoris]
MVSTRARARSVRGSDTHSSDSEGDAHAISSGEDEPTPRRRSGRPTANKTATAAAAAETAAAAVVDTSPSQTQGEQLGRGCRVSRSSVSLDEQYLAASLYRSSIQQRGYAGAGRRSHSSPRTHEEAFVVSRRYPIREAAKRAMENLHVTLTSANGAAALDDDDDDDDETSNSVGVFHFRHHPEMVEEISRKREKQRQRLQHRYPRRRRQHGSSDASSSDEDTSESDGSSSGTDTGEESDSSSTSPNNVRGKADQSPPGHPPRMATAASTQAMPCRGGNASAASSPRESGGTGDSTRPTTTTAATPATRRTTTSARPSSHNNDDAISLDSSITEASMREESVERAEMHDRHARLSPSSSAASSDNGDGTRDFANEAERRRAVRNARESVRQNLNVNYYMADAVGVEGARKIRRRQLDRRYRWLVHQEEEARARGDGSGGTATESSSSNAVTTANGALGDILPLRVDDDVTFDSVGGLPEHIVTLREMVLLPLLYPDLFERLDLRAPRGVLFVGPPGTGKTLMARALANEGSKFVCGGSGGTSSQRITFFVRKGADMLSKWVGESERQLKLLFEEAKRLQPSIIFFDEVDGLAPTRHAKTEQTQAALVSTLLALLDGLEDRGQVVVIGATNRPDTLDPALRRPGRFDRELVFPLPDAAARRHILTIQLAKKAMPDSAEKRTALLRDLVEMTEGYSGADLGALCTEASLHRLRTALPQLYLSSARLVVPREVEQTRLHVRTEDFYAAAQLMQPSLRRCRTARHSDSSFLDAYVEVLVRGTRDATLAALAPSWSLVDKVVRAGSRDCQDMATAVRALCAVPIPQPPRPCLLVLHEAQPLTPVSAISPPPQRHQQQQQQQRRALQLHHLSISLLKGLPGLHQITVNLPELVWESDVPAAASSAWSLRGLSTHANPNADFGGVSDDFLGNASGGGGDSFTHMGQVVQSVRQCSPCVVYLNGAEEWLSDLHGLDDDDDDDNEQMNAEKEGQEEHALGLRSEKNVGRSSATAAETTTYVSRRQQRRVQLFRYYMNMLADTDVIFLLPCATTATCELLLGQSPDHSHHNHSVDHGNAFPDSASVMEQSVASSEFFSIASPSPSSPMLTVDPPTAVHLTRMSAQHQQLHPRFSIVFAGIATSPLPADLRRFVTYVHRIVAMTLLLHRGEGRKKKEEDHGTPTTAGGADGERHDVPVLREDPAPLPSPLAHAQLRARRRADRARRCDVWRKVEYRRLQLRHVLMKWVTQYVNSGKFRLLVSADLDLAPDDPLCKAWREHTRKHRVGLQDILENIEDEKYVCLSQYHDDVDQLVRNVRSFFRTRASQDQRYRLKALDLKETCLLNMYKMNREVIRFCEETRDLQEPSSSDSDAEARSTHERTQGKDRRHHKQQRSERDGSEGADVNHADRTTSLVRRDEDPALIAEQMRRAVSFSQRPAAPPRKRRRGGWTPTERRRRRKRVSAAGKSPQATVEKSEDEDSRSNSADDAEGNQKGEPDAKSDPPQQERDPNTDADESVEVWACTVLSTFTYSRLYHVFRTVMRGLEVEVRLLDGNSTPQRQQQPPPPLRSDALADSAEAVPAAEEDGKNTETESTAAPRSRNSYVTAVFKKLLLAAVQE